MFILLSDIFLEHYDVVLCQHVRNPEGNREVKFGYLDDSTVPNGSVTLTYTLTFFVLITSFILICGKGKYCLLYGAPNTYYLPFIIVLNLPVDTFNGKPIRNDFVIRVQSGEALYVKLMVNTPVMGIDRRN